MHNILLLFVLLFFAGCSQVGYNQQPHLKAFEDEDTLILYALDRERTGEFAAASLIYDTLYKESRKREYFIRSMAMLMHAGDFDTVVARTSDALETDPDWHDVQRLQVQALVAQQRYEDAKNRALELLDKTKNSADYQLVSSIYISLKRFDMALKYLERAYAINYDEVILDKMAIILYVNLKRQKEAIAHLESHSRLHGCSKVICKRLAGFYSEQNNVEGMLATYMRLYDAFEEEDVADAIVKIYSYQKDSLRLIAFLERSHSNDDLLLDLYINAKRYSSAHALATQLYERTGKLRYLGQSAIFEYEKAEDKSDKTMLTQVMKRLQSFVAQEPEPLFLNYLGYMMIDHDLGVEEGIVYVQKALESEPDSAYYLDSLAWGYYKLERCVEALAILTRVTEELGNDDKEVLMHMKAVKTCLEGKEKE